MDSPPILAPAAATTPLGVPGYTFADLHDPDRLASLYDRFCEEAAAADPALWSEWDAYRTNPDALAAAPVKISNLLEAMAPHVSRFVARLFEIGPRADALARATRDQDDLFRFKVDFVRRRALPLLKGGAHVESTADDDAVVARLTAGASRRRSGAGHCARRLRAARCGEGESQIPKSRMPTVESLKRWCAARLHDRAYRDWVIFRFPENARLLASGRCAAAGSAAAGSDDRARLAAAPPRRLHADRRAHEAARSAQRDPLLRAVPRARQGFLLERHPRQGRGASRSIRSALRSTAVRSTRRFPRCTRCARSATRSARSRSSIVDNPMCPGTGHRICNDCMKACIYQKQEPVNIPADRNRGADRRAADAVGRRDLRPAHALESAQRPPPLRAAVQRQERARRRSGTGGLHARALSRQRRIRRRRHRRFEDRAAARRDRRQRDAAPRPIRDWSEIYRRLDDRVLEGFGGVSEYGITVRWDKNFLTLLHLTLARRRGLAMYGGVRFGGTLPIEDAWALRLRSRRDRGRRRPADGHRHEEQPDSRHPEGERLPDGAAADRRVQARRRSRTCRRGCRPS